MNSEAPATVASAMPVTAGEPVQVRNTRFHWPPKWPAPPSSPFSFRFTCAPMGPPTLYGSAMPPSFSRWRECGWRAPCSSACAPWAFCFRNASGSRTSAAANLGQPKPLCHPVAWRAVARRLSPHPPGLAQHLRHATGGARPEITRPMSLIIPACPPGPDAEGGAKSTSNIRTMTGRSAARAPQPRGSWVASTNSNSRIGTMNQVGTRCCASRPTGRSALPGSWGW